MADNEAITIRVEVNGGVQTLEVPARMTLADALRDQLGLTGTHLGCEHGVCGSCTVLVDDRTARSCLTLAVQVDGRRVTTIEGLSSDELSPLQRAFAERGGLQCGFCTPGFVVAATELLRDTPTPDEAAVRSALSGNTCRCTGYETIVDAVLDSVDQDRQGQPPRWPDAGPAIGGDALDAPPGPTSHPGAPEPAMHAATTMSGVVEGVRSATAGPRRTAWVAAAGLLAAGAVGVWFWERTRRSTG